MKSYIADTYAWMAYFQENKAYQKIIDGQENQFKTPAIVFAELARIFYKKGIAEKEAKELLDFVRDRSVVVALDYQECVKAGETAWREQIPLADAMIYAFASKDEPLLTGDDHFKGKPNVEFIK
ncbi:MAG: PIN domain-containing protein [Candidatus Micrarchaeota archaeon]